MVSPALSPQETAFDSWGDSAGLTSIAPTAQNHTAGIFCEKYRLKAGFHELRGQRDFLHPARRGRAGRTSRGLLPLCRLQSLVGARAGPGGGGLPVLRYGFHRSGWAGRRQVRLCQRSWPRPSRRNGPQSPRSESDLWSAPAANRCCNWMSA